ncbi:Mbeg1-like protein [Paenibacillus sp.]|uniref:Mbeg1-like protein n=1 Tax=Paenibacillus sp. TaxID=58172 RepID=UPI00281149FF|nr:Mbeg1-like protein [Paenibacillus sp.]
MGNMLDYLDWRGDLTLEQAPFNEVDNLVLSQLAYVNFDYIVPPEWIDASISIREAAERYFHLYSEDRIQSFGHMLRNSVSLLRKVRHCSRFANAKLSKFQNIVDLDRTKQFAAMHVELEDGTLYVAYRGTDSTIVGWKENFNMTVTTPVPSQFEAVRYLEDTAGEGSSPLRLGGHSKGGNLAAYAAVMCRVDVKARIIEVYNNDGPGFDEKITRRDAYLEMRDRIRTIVPQASVVGMLLEHVEAFAVVRSNQSLLMQHDAFSWEVMGPKFVRAEQVARESRMVVAALKSWLGQLAKPQREQFVEALFQIFQAADVWTIEDLSRAKWKKVTHMIRALNQSQEQKVVLTKTLKLLFHEGRKSLMAMREEKVP